MQSVDLGLAQQGKSENMARMIIITLNYNCAHQPNRSFEPLCPNDFRGAPDVDLMSSRFHPIFGFNPHCVFLKLSFSVDALCSGEAED